MGPPPLISVMELDCFAAVPINVIRPDKMETATTVFNVSASEENIDVKQGAENDNTASGQKRTHETEEEDDDGKRKRRKGEDLKESKTRPGTNGRGKDRKSPNTVQAENTHNDSDEDKKSNEPKVPPLKIVLSNTNEVDTSVRSKNGNGRGSLAYVVSTSEEKNENSNGSSEKCEDKGKDNA